MTKTKVSKKFFFYFPPQEQPLQLSHYTPSRLIGVQRGIHLPPSLTHLIFHYSFNCPISINPSSENHFQLPSSLTHLAFGDTFTQPIESLPPHLTHLSFGTQFNGALKDLPSSLTHLWFGDIYNKPLHPVPVNLIYLKFGTSFNLPLDLSSCTKLTHIIFGYKFNQPLHYLPNTLTHLHFSVCYAQPLNVIPPKLVYLFLKRIYNFPLPTIPPSLRYLHLESDDPNFSPPSQISELVWTDLEEYNFSHFPNLTLLSITAPLTFDKYPPNITHLIIDTQVIKVTATFPLTLTHLECYSSYISCTLPPNLILLRAQRVSSPLPPSLKYLRLTEHVPCNFDHLINLTHFSFLAIHDKVKFTIPPFVTHLQLIGAFNSVPVLPPTVTHINLGDRFNQPLDFLSKNVKYVRLGHNFNQPLSLLPDSVIKLDVYRCLCTYNSDETAKLPKSLKYFVYDNTNVGQLEVPSRIRVLFQRIPYSFFMPTMEISSNWKAPTYSSLFECESGTSIIYHLT